jgi:hypothetical protein
MKWPLVSCLALLSATPVVSFSQQSSYGGSNITGQLVLARTVNVSQLSLALTLSGNATGLGPEAAKVPARLRRPATLDLGLTLAFPSLNPSALTQLLPVVQQSPSTGFSALTHRHQRLANGGNQFSVEPPNPSIAMANGYILEGVNNAIQVYDANGGPQLSKVLSSNELFGVRAAINRTTGENGVYPTDMRVFYDHSISRWFVLQRAQDYDYFGNIMNSSHLYLAVSQSADPLGGYNIYEMNTSNSQNPGCPCIADYPQIGADQYGFYISANEFGIASESFVDSTILAVSKASLASGAVVPTLYRFLIPLADGFGFAIQPAYTPPGASYFVASGGLEYFMSTQGSFSVANSMAVWAMYNTASLGTVAPALGLTRIVVPTLTYAFPDKAVQASGPLPYGSSRIPPGPLANLDGGDMRVQALTYAGGRLYVSLATAMADDTGRAVVGGAYAILSPALRSSVLSANILRQGYIGVRNGYLLRPAMAVNARGQGAIAFTLVGSSYYPSAAFVPFSNSGPGAAVQVAGAGSLPEDGFTGYTGGYSTGVARWGDYATSVIGTDGNVWMVTEYIPNAARTELANWGTYVWRLAP